MSTNGHLKFQGTNRATFVGETSNIMFDTTTTSLGIGVTGTDHPSSNLYITGNAYISNSISVGGVLTMGTVNVVARHDLEAVTAMGNTTPLTIEFSNATTGIVTTGNVEVGGELTVSGNVNMLHTANTASIKLNSNVVTEFPRSKKLIKYPRVAMTQNDESGTSGYVTNASSWENQANNETYGPWNNFNGILNDSAWQSTPRRFSQTTGDWDGTTTAPYAISLVGGTTIYGEWVELKIPNKIQLHTCRIAPMTHSTLTNLGRHRSPRSGYILGRVGATGNWTILKSWSDVIYGWEDLVLRDFDIENPSEYYDYFRVVWTAINGNNNYSTSAGAGYASSGEIEFLGVPEYDPEAHGVDVKVKSVPNVPNTDWLDIYIDGQDYSTMPSGNGSVLDKSTNNRHGTPSNVTFNSTWKAFEIESASTSNITIPFNSTGGAYVHTISLWFWMDTTAGGNRCIFTIRGSESTGRQIALIINQDTTTVGFKYDFYGSDVRHYDPSVVANKWMHVTLTYSGGNNTVDSKEIYLNGIKLNVTTSGTSPLNLTGTENLIIGGNLNSSNASFEGMVANFRMFNRVLTSDEIYQLYAYQKEYFGHSTNSMTLKAGRLGIGTSEPRVALDVRGDLRVDGHSQLETLAPRYYSSMQRGTFHNVSSHIITGFDHQAEGYATPVLGWEVHINFNHHRATTATHVEIDGGYLSTAPSTHVSITETATRKYDEDTSAFSFYTDRFYIGSDMAHAHAAAYAVIRITNSQVPGIPSAIHTANSSTVRYHMLGHTMYVKPGVGSCLDVAIGKISGGNNARLHGIRVATGADNITGSYTVYTYH
jgi:hypothetical protein